MQAVLLVVKGKDQTQELIPALPLSSCVTLLISLNLCEPQVLNLLIQENDNSTS